MSGAIHDAQGVAHVEKDNAFGLVFHKRYLICTSWIRVSPNDGRAAQAHQRAIGCGKWIGRFQKTGSGRGRIKSVNGARVPGGFRLYARALQKVTPKTAPDQEDDAPSVASNQMLDDLADDRLPKSDVSEFLFRCSALFIMAERETRIEPENARVFPLVKLFAGSFEIQRTGTQSTLHSRPTACRQVSG